MPKHFAAATKGSSSNSNSHNNNNSISTNSNSISNNNPHSVVRTNFASGSVSVPIQHHYNYEDGNSGSGNGIGIGSIGGIGGIHSRRNVSNNDNNGILKKDRKKVVQIAVLPSSPSSPDNNIDKHDSIKNNDPLLTSSIKQPLQYSQQEQQQYQYSQHQSHYSKQEHEQLQQEQSLSSPSHSLLSSLSPLKQNINPKNNTNNTTTTTANNNNTPTPQPIYSQDDKNNAPLFISFHTIVTIRTKILYKSFSIIAQPQQYPAQLSRNQIIDNNTNAIIDNRHNNNNSNSNIPSITTTTSNKENVIYEASLKGVGLGQCNEGLRFILIENSPSLNSSSSSNIPLTPLTPLTPASSSSTAARKNEEDEDDDNDEDMEDMKDTVLRYGDIVAIRSTFANDRALGVRRCHTHTNNNNNNTNNNNNNNPKYEVGFFRNIIGRAEGWTVLCGAPNRIIAVGSSAATTALLNNNTSSSSPMSPSPSSHDSNSNINNNNNKNNNNATTTTTTKGGISTKTLRKKNKIAAPVRSGDAILLRNSYTGGLLSFHTGLYNDDNDDDDGVGNNNTNNKEGQLTVITSSYPSSSTTTSTSATNNNNNTMMDSMKIESLELMERQHLITTPSITETFQIVLANVPPTPNWAYPSSTTTTTEITTTTTTTTTTTKGPGYERVYLTGNHLHHPNRNHDVTFQNKESASLLLFQDDATGPRGSVAIRDKHTHIYPIGRQNPHVQEQILIDELLGCMMGLEGRCLRATTATTSTITNEAKIRFEIASHHVTGGKVHPNLVSLTRRILPICNAYVHVNQYVSSRPLMYEYGRVVHALCGIMDELMVEYLNLVTRLEDAYRRGGTTTTINDNNDDDDDSTMVDVSNSNDSTTTTMHTKKKKGVVLPFLSLTVLHGAIQSAARTMQILDRVVTVVSPLKGGALLNALHVMMELEYRGDEQAHILFNRLLGRASQPYVNILNRWLEKGELDDPYGEFMIVQNQNHNHQGGGGGDNFQHRPDVTYMNSREDWNNWFSVQDKHILGKMFPDSSSYGYQLLRGTAAQATSTPNDMDDTIRKVLTAGKYWNAIALCYSRNEMLKQSHASIEIGTAASVASAAAVVMYNMSSVEISRCIDTRYERASKTFLNVLMADYHLIDNLRFMRKYFLLDQGDFFVHFLDMAEDELLQKLSDVKRGRVESWMNMSIQHCNLSEGVSTNSVGPQHLHDPTKSQQYRFAFGEPFNSISSSLRCDFATQSLVDQLNILYASDGGIDSQEPRTPSRHVYGGPNKGLTGVDAFMLDFNQIPSPLSLILSRKTISNYQLLFRHLFLAKHVERRLFGTWLDHQTIKEYQTLRKDLGPTYCLRQRMLHFMQNFVYYMMFEVIEPNWIIMESKIQGNDECVVDELKQTSKFQQIRTVDDILSIHDEFLIKTLKECLLTNHGLIKALTKLMTACLLFSDQMRLFMETTGIVHEQSMIATEERQRRQLSMFNYNDATSGNRKKRLKEAREAAQEQRRGRKLKQMDNLKQELNSLSYKKMISRFEQVFNTRLSEFMVQLMSNSEEKYHTHLSNLCMRLDYNGYVAQSIKAI